ncbi:MAG: class I SAM-dependent methyltransferase [Thermoplasmata archaeon]|nr:MAG: class I SAM-dependent methyltransferase [Thermoplasmata archaeon]
MDKERIVQESYNRLGKSYQDTRLKVKNIDELKRFTELIPQKGKILDAGCGTGLPTTRYLIENGYEVIGIDFSDEMLRLAKENVPDAVFIKQNIIDLDFPDNFFDGLISLYVIIHISREKHRGLFQQFHEILKPGGILLVTMGSMELEETGEFLGEEMYWSHYNPKTSLKLIEESGFSIIEEWFTSYNWFSEDEKHYWILAKNND